jgi:CheY-like chemotaxis protein
MNSIIADMKIMMHRLIGEDFDLLTALEPSLGRVKADPNQVEQIILNLAVNARDAMPGGGKITIETANAELDSTDVKRHMDVQPGLYVMLAVRDNGCGISQEVQQRIFESFYHERARQGTGLGLSTVYGIVKQSDGHIWVDSEVGRGTTFKIYLPCVEEALTNSESKAKSGELLYGKETILLVEDDELVRQMASDILKTVGYTILEAQHGGEALSICKQHQEPLDLILTDVVMPQMSGRELAERVALIRPKARVLYMSGYTDDAIVHHGVLDEGTPF